MYGRRFYSFQWLGGEFGFEPLSVVLDKNGIYYNATQASDLENLLIKINLLNDEQNQRIEHLINKLLTQQVSKYNVGKNKKIID